MSYTFSQITPTRYRFLTGTTVLDLDSTNSNGIGILHGQIIDLVVNDEQKKNRLGELLELDDNSAYSIFCAENNLEIPPEQ